MTEEQAIDCVSRQKVKEGMIKYGFHAPDMTVTEFIEDELPPVTPKIPTSEDCVSRADLLAQINESWETIETKIDFVNIVKASPSVTPTQGTCKDCKHFHNVRKDFNVCDLWTIACTDNHYCADFGKRGDKNEDN